MIEADDLKWAALDLPQQLHALPNLGELEFVVTLQHGAPILRRRAFIGLYGREDKRFFSKSRAELYLEKRHRQEIGLGHLLLRMHGEHRVRLRTIRWDLINAIAWVIGVEGMVPIIY